MVSTSPRTATDALAVLAADHRAVRQWLAEFDELAAQGGPAARRRELALRACQLLTAHAIGAQDVFYPALRAALGEDDDLVDDAEAGHDGIRALVEQIEDMAAGDERFDALVIMLARALDRHAALEEGALFARAQACGLDLPHLGERIARRRDQALQLLSDDT